jgi:hypothetical protein
MRPTIDGSLDRRGEATCRALIRGGWDRGHEGVVRFGVALFMPDQ